MSDAYSPLKATRYLDRIAAIRSGEPAPPVHVQLILSDLCNQGCSFCAYRDPRYTSSTLFFTREDGKKGLRYAEFPERNYNPNRQIPTAKAKEILDDCAEMGVRAIQFTGGGEPTVHPDFREIAEYTNSLGMKWALVTNGVNVERKDMVDLMPTASWVRFSLDAAKPETYSSIRRVPPSQFDDACAAIQRTANLATDTVIGVGFVVTPDNWREVVEFTALADRLGADNVRISAQFSADDENLFAGFYEEAAALCKEAESLAGEGFQVYNRFGEKLDDLRQGRPNYQRCGYQQLTTYIGGDLNLYRCCVYAYHPSGLLGSMRDRRFKDAWADAVRGMPSFNARSCERCQFNRINQNLAYILAEDDPMHAEFV